MLTYLIIRFWLWCRGGFYVIKHKRLTSLGIARCASFSSDEEKTVNKCLVRIK